MNKISKIILDHLDMDGVAIGDIIYNKGEDQWEYGGKYRRRLFPIDSNRVDIETLESLNLLKDMSFKNAPFEGYEISVFFHRVTPLCVDMFSACNPDIFIARQVKD